MKHAYLIYTHIETKNLDSDMPLTVGEIKKKIFGRQRKPYLFENKIIAGQKAVIHFNGIRMDNDDFIIPMFSDYPVQIWGEKDIENPFPKMSNEIYY